MPAQVDFDWTVRFISRSREFEHFEGDEPDKLEDAAIAELGSNAGEVWQGLPDGTWRLVAALRTEDNCYHCHGRTQDGVTRHDMGPLGYVSVTLARKLKDKKGE
jgi:hypothetical protein